MLDILPKTIRSEIGSITEGVKNLQAFWPNDIQLIADQAESIYAFYPYLFLDAFPSLKISDIRPLAIAGKLLSGSILVTDSLLDEATSALSYNVLRVMAMQVEGYHVLHQLFSPDALFWQYLHDYFAQFVEACVQEKSFIKERRPWKDYSEAFAFQSIIGRTCIARGAIAGLVELAHGEGLLAPLTASVDHHNIAIQMLDDLSDWKEDLRNGVPSILLARVIANQPVQCESEVAFKRYTLQLSKELYYGGHVRSILEIALKSLDQAEDCITNLPTFIWNQHISTLRVHCQSLLQDINRIVSENLRRRHEQPRIALELPSAQTSWETVGWKALRFILDQWQRGFSEARHVMLFPHGEGREIDSVQYGDVFQRALIADALCEVDSRLEQQLQPVLDYEAQHLLSCRRSTGIGGWSYFPDLPELPPDVDDLAEVMQVFLRCGFHELVVQSCEGPLSVWLRDAAHQDGSFETWIVPQNELTSEQQAQVEAIRKDWGSGADTDVIANILYALLLYDPKRFANVISHGASYLQSQQGPDGSWSSTWYHGPYYGTYVCLRLLVQISPFSPSIAWALDFVRTSQHADGGWGLDDTSDPLSTALALLALVYGSCGDLSDLLLLERGLAYLQAQQSEDGGWNACPLIRMELGRATGQVSAVLSYGSRTVTTAFIFKVAMVCNRLMGGDTNITNRKESRTS